MNPEVQIPLCPKLQRLKWRGKTLAEQNLPLAINELTALSKLVVEVDSIDPTYRFPIQLTELELKVRDARHGERCCHRVDTP